MSKNMKTDSPVIDERLIINRRKFFKLMGSGLLVTFTITQGIGRDRSILKESEDKIGGWIHIGANGRVTIYTGKAEVGQNIRTSLAQIVAEELEVPMASIDMVMGDTDLTPYDRGTFGSRSIPYMGPQLRKAAASAREYILDTAAQIWKTQRSKVSIVGGVVTDGGQHSLPIGEISKGEKLVRPLRDDVPLKTIDSWKIAGTSVPKVNGESFVTGKHKYVSDMKLPGMHYGKVLRAPAYGAKLISVNTEVASQIPGVTMVQDGDFIGVVAASPRVATLATSKIDAKWQLTKQPSKAEIFSYLKSKEENRGSTESDHTGNAKASFETSAIKIDKTFTVDYIAHVPLEPRAGVAEWKGDKLTVWTGTQRPFGVQEELEETFRIPKDKIRVIMPDTGSGYGGKHTGEAGIEAARLSKAAGKPVKLVWTREEEFTWAYFRPAGIIEVKAACGKDGKLTSWAFHNYNSGPSGIATPYDIENKETLFHPCDSPLRQGSYRGLAATANTFARECIMNDLADELKMDQLSFRLKNLSSQRMIDVLNAAANKFGWSTYKSEAGHGIGIACGEEKGSFVATCAEVKIDSGSGRTSVTKVAVAFECGAIINPHHLEAQISGSIVQGLGGALFESINFKDGKILNPSLSTYRVPRFSDIPKIEIVTLNRKDLAPAGAGETPILAIAPAIRNAMARANGKKLYTLPLQQDPDE